MFVLQTNTNKIFIKKLHLTLETLKNQRVAALFAELKKRQLVRNQTQFAEMIGSDKATVSSVVNCKLAVPNNMFAKIVGAFPLVSLNWLETGDGEMIQDKGLQPASGKDLQISGGGDAVPAEAGTVNRLLDELAAQRQMTEKSQGQIDRLLTIIENLQKR